MDTVPDFDTILLSVDGAKFRRIVQPGDQLRIETKLISNRRMIAKIHGAITVDGENAAEATMMFMLVPKASRSGEKKDDK
jgi:3-hydroxyacyl-[acyl-carrier-protein] dehydratase